MATQAEWLAFRRLWLKGQDDWRGFYKCERCGLELEYAEVDHIIKRSLRPDLVLDGDNLRILCRRCHDYYTNRLKRPANWRRIGG